MDGGFIDVSEIGVEASWSGNAEYSLYVHDPIDEEWAGPEDEIGTAYANARSVPLEEGKLMVFEAQDGEYAIKVVLASGDLPSEVTIKYTMDGDVFYSRISQFDQYGEIMLPSVIIEDGRVVSP